MAGSLININLSVDRVCTLLRDMEDVTFFDLPDGLGMEFAQGGVARAYDADPDGGTDINVKSASDVVPRRVFEFLKERTTEALWMTDDFSEIVATRGITAEEINNPSEPVDP